LVEYNSAREVEDLVKFVSADWSSEPFGAWIYEAELPHNVKKGGIPAELTAFKEFSDDLKKDMNELYKFKKNALAVTLIVGFLLGWLFKGLCTSSSKVHSE
jgi:hypothetical protein